MLKTEKQKLKSLEDSIRKSFSRCTQIGEKLTIIRDEKLYTYKGYRSFKEYCRDTFNISGTHAYRQIKHYTFCRSVGEDHQVVPEKTTRLLAPFTDDIARSIWVDAKKAASRIPSTKELQAKIDQYKDNLSKKGNGEIETIEDILFSHKLCTDDVRLACYDKYGFIYLGTFRDAEPCADGGWRGLGTGEWIKIPNYICYNNETWRESLVFRTVIPYWCKKGALVYSKKYDTYLRITDITKGGTLHGISFNGYEHDCIYSHNDIYDVDIVPYNEKEMKALIGKVINIVGDTVWYMVSAYSKFADSVLVGENWITSKELVDKWEIDGKPCGKIKIKNEESK